jgi:hypothetical protein
MMPAQSDQETAMPHYGKYRGMVVNNVDPQLVGRLQVEVPAVLGTDVSAWALPCLQPGAPVELPRPGASVWVEFEGGNPDYPIWCGVFWTAAADAIEALGAPLQP